MKKLKYLLLSVLVFMPVSVFAAYGTYEAGELANFISNDTEKEASDGGAVDVGTLAIVLSDGGSEAQYVRALALKMTAGSSYLFNNTDYKLTSAYTNSIGSIQLNFNISSPYIKDPLTEDAYSFVSKDELVNIFGADFTDPNKGVINVEKYGSSFKQLVENLNVMMEHDDKLLRGIYTSTVEGNYVWVLKFEQDSTGKITAITVEKADITNTDNYYGVAPVLCFNKEYDCRSVCYSCDGEYKWARQGSQPATCQIVANAKTKDKCVKNPKTGIEDHALEILGVIAVCGLGLGILKKKDFFRA